MFLEFRLSCMNRWNFRLHPKNTKNTEIRQNLIEQQYPQLNRSWNFYWFIQEGLKLPLTDERFVSSYVSDFTGSQINLRFLDLRWTFQRQYSMLNTTFEDCQRAQNNRVIREPYIHFLLIFQRISNSNEQLRFHEFSIELIGSLRCFWDYLGSVRIDNFSCVELKNREIQKLEWIS